jgi:hypothetical protein
MSIMRIEGKGSLQDATGRYIHEEEFLSDPSDMPGKVYVSGRELPIRHPQGDRWYIRAIR